MSERASLSTHHRELMLSLAYLGGLTYALALRILPCYSERTLQRDLADLRRLGDVEKHAIYKPGPKGRPVKQYDIWTLTDQGHRYIASKASDQYPTKPTRLRHKRVMPHDLLWVRTIVAMVDRARQEDLSGLFVQCETRLDPEERRPIPDAVAIMQFGGGFGRTEIVPWTKDPAIEDETRSRFVIEADFQTETLSVIAGKARAYRAAFENPQWRAWWIAQFGPLPIIIWVVADKDDDPQPAVDRLASIFRVWDAEWPTGYWAGTTEHRMEQERWAVHADGEWGWRRQTTMQTERHGITKTTRSALPAADSHAVMPPATSGSPAPVGAREPATGIATTTIAPAPTAELVTQPTPPAGAAAIVSLGSDTGLGQRAAVLPSVGDQWADRGTPDYHAYPITPIPTRPVYVPPASTLPEPPPDRAWLAMLLRDGYDEICYVITGLLKVLGIVWLVRTSARLIAWFFWDEGYVFVGLFLGLLACLGVLGWGGYDLYRTYRADPLFSFGQQVPTPTAADVIAPMAATVLQPEELPPLLNQPTLPPTCGEARVVSEGLNLRTTPGGSVLTVLYRGEQVVLLCEVQRLGATTWVHVHAGQHEGWVSERYLRPAGPGN